MIDHFKHEGLNELFADLPADDRKRLEPALRKFLKSQDAIGDGELPCCRKVSWFLSDNFGDMKSLWAAPPNTAPPGDSIAQTVAWVNATVYGFDLFGLRKVEYIIHDEFRERFESFPKHIKDQLWNIFRVIDHTEELWALLDNDGYIYGDRLVAWCVKKFSKLDGKVMRQVMELAHTMDEINRKVMANRAGAVANGGIIMRDTGIKPFAQLEDRLHKPPVKH